MWTGRIINNKNREREKRRRERDRGRGNIYGSLQEKVLT